MSDKIKTVKDLHSRGIEEYALLIARKHRKKLSGELADIAVKAEINHGRWVVKCPFCPGAELGDPENPRFMCLSCYNQDAGGKWLKVEYQKQAGKIETELLKRPKKHNQNWTPGESLKQLQDENVSRGVV